MGVAVTFIALLELLREHVVEIVQAEPFSRIHVRAAASPDAAGGDPTFDAAGAERDAEGQAGE